MIKNYYNSSLFNIDINKLLIKYNILKKEIIGKSVLEKEIIAIKIGKGKNRVILTGAIHSNEWLTTILLLKYIQWFCEKINSKEYVYKKINLKQIYEEYNIVIIPLLNPDGLDVVNNNINNALNNKLRIIALNYPEFRFPQDWKANINGVDLNLQFPAQWEKAKDIKYNLGYNKPSPKNYVGNNYLSEPESVAIYNYINLNNCNKLFCFHSQGECIYYKYNNKENKKAKEIAKKLSQVSGYSLEDIPYESSFAGLKDWYIDKYNNPAFTIEIGKGINPLPINQVNKIFSNNLELILYGIIL